MTETQRILIGKINGNNVFKYSYAKGKSKLNSLMAEGMIFRFAEWINAEFGYDYTVREMYNNTSCIRDGNRLDLHDNIEICDGREFIFIYMENQTVWAVIYNRKNDTYLGEMEVPYV